VDCDVLGFVTLDEVLGGRKSKGEIMARIVRFHEYGDASVPKIENLDVPPPGPHEVQIEVKSIGLNRAENMFRTHAYLQEAQFPSRLGYEAAGIVKTVGTSVTTSAHRRHAL
jgi:NADPH:quinone reductase-like Zn-dependent oxidoreductase